MVIMCLITFKVISVVDTLTVNFCEVSQKNIFVSKKFFDPFSGGIITNASGS
jgi:hypothetical protein